MQNKTDKGASLVSKSLPVANLNSVNHLFSATKTKDYVLANETCPMFTGEVGKRLHIGFDDPSDAVGSDEFVMSEFRRVRDEIKEGFERFYTAVIAKNH